jgi:hypothetical protein
MTISARKLALAAVLGLLCLGSARFACAQAPPPTPGGGEEYSSSLATLVSDDLSDPADATDSKGPSAPSTNFLATPPAPKPQTGIDWLRLGASSITFLSIEHAFRCATEQGTRDAFSTAFWPGYINAAASLHGWADGDPFLVNYVGHPMQGAVTGFMWQHNDRAYRDAVFGKNTRYWKARLRGMAFAYVYSVQFEIGPVSEASLGQVQALYPAYGFVDHVITPIIGTGWAIAEDSIDKYIIRTIEAHTANPYLRLFARGALNPSRSMSNVMNYELPWHRDDRPGVFKPYPESAAMKAMVARDTARIPVNPPPGVAPFEFTFASNMTTYFGSGAKGSCIGGGGSAAFRLAPDWQVVLNVDGCKIQDLPAYVTGDSLTYMIGPRWTPSTSGRWSPHAQVLVGGNKLTQEQLFPDERAAVIAEIAPKKLGNAQHVLFTKDWETSGFAIALGTGVDYKLNNALAWRVASLDYQHSWNNELNGVNYQNGLSFTMGLVLHMGTW